MSELRTFLGALARKPAGVGAIAPSSRALASTMVALAHIQDGDHVVELGAGTGPMTRALRDAHPHHDVLVLEPDPGLAAKCRENVPGVEVAEAYAQELPKLIADRGWPHVDRVVSSLPFAAWPAPLQKEVFDAILTVLKPGGRLVTFTYAHSPYLPAGRRARALLERTFDRVHLSPVIWGNVPPAFVYVCDRAP